MEIEATKALLAKVGMLIAFLSLLNLMIAARYVDFNPFSKVLKMTYSLNFRPQQDVKPLLRSTTLILTCILLGCTGLFVGCSVTETYKAAYNHGYDLSTYQSRMLSIDRPSGKTRLQQEIDYDKVVKAYIKDYGNPDYLYVESIDKIYLVYRSPEKFVTFTRSSWITSASDVKEAWVIPSIFKSQMPPLVVTQKEQTPPKGKESVSPVVVVNNSAPPQAVRVKSVLKDKIVANEQAPEQKESVSQTAVSDKANAAIDTWSIDEANGKATLLAYKVNFLNDKQVEAMKVLLESQRYGDIPRVGIVFHALGGDGLTLSWADEYKNIKNTKTMDMGMKPMKVNEKWVKMNLMAYRNSSYTGTVYWPQTQGDLNDVLCIFANSDKVLFNEATFSTKGFIKTYNQYGIMLNYDTNLNYCKYQ